MSEAAKFRTLDAISYVTGRIIDIGCGHDKITPDAIGWDGREMPGVDIVSDDPYKIKTFQTWLDFDTVFSSHFLEHLANPYAALMEWRELLKPGGHLVLYLPDGDHYDNKENKEHMQDMRYADFVFWFSRAFCGEGKDFKGNDMPKLFDLVTVGTDYGDNRYSFYVVAKRV